MGILILNHGCELVRYSHLIVSVILLQVPAVPGMELRVGSKYRLGRKIGSGSFGDIYLGMYDNVRVLRCWTLCSVLALDVKLTEHILLLLVNPYGKSHCVDISFDISGTDVSNGEEVGIKLECVKLKHPQLHIESKIYKILQGGGMYSHTLGY